MKKLFFILALFFVLPTLALSAEKVKVRGHWRDSNGDGLKDTYVDPYQRTSPNKTKSDNYGYPGNYNPNTGEMSSGSSNSYYNKSGKEKY